MSEIEKINNDLVVDDLVYRPTSTLPNQNIEGHLCINYNGKVLEFKDIDCANYVKTLRKLLKECKPYIALYTENNKHIGFTPETANLLQRIKEVLK